MNYPKLRPRRSFSWPYGSCVNTDGVCAWCFGSPLARAGEELYRRKLRALKARYRRGWARMVRDG